MKFVLDPLENRTANRNQISTQWDMPPVFERMIIISTAAIAASCQVSGFVVSHFYDHTKGMDLAFAGSLIFRVAAAITVHIIYQHEKIRQPRFVIFASLFGLTALGGIAIKVSTDGDWFLLVSQ